MVRVAPAISTIFSAWNDPVARILNVDLLAVAVAVLLPWSTSGVAICISLWVAALIPTINWRDFAQSLNRSISLLPSALFLLALIGTLWSDVAWSERLQAVNPTIKLLVLPLLFYHFERSNRGIWVFSAFVLSCLGLMLVSLIVAFDPSLSLKRTAYSDVGIFVKDRIAQSQEFSLCALALIYPVLNLWNQKRIPLAILLSSLAVTLITSMFFVATSRTALIAMPVMMVCLLFYFRRAIALGALAAILILTALSWFSSPVLRSKIASFSSQYYQYKDFNKATSIGLRLEFWQKSAEFFREAPVVGHGTGSVRNLFERAAVGRTGAAAEVIGNPHNQTLYVAIQWGVTGIALLYAMWLIHFLLFRGVGLANWIGLLVVIQNFTSSLFNSHLFDFHEGWMYVLGVGVAGGMVIRNRRGLLAERTHASKGKPLDKLPG